MLSWMRCIRKKLVIRLNNIIERKNFKFKSLFQYLLKRKGLKVTQLYNNITSEVLVINTLLVYRKLLDLKCKKKKNMNKLKQELFVFKITNKLLIK